MAKWIVLSADYWQSKPDEKTGVVRESLKITAFKPTPTKEQGKHGHPPQQMVADTELLPVFSTFPAVYDLDLEPHVIWVEKKQVQSLKIAEATFVSAVSFSSAPAPAAAASK